MLYREGCIDTLYNKMKPVPMSAKDIEVDNQQNKLVIVLKSTQGVENLDGENECGDCDRQDCDGCDCYNDGTVAKVVDLDDKTRVTVLSCYKDEDGKPDYRWSIREWVVNGTVQSVTDAMDDSYLIVTDKEVVFTNNGHRKRIASGAAAAQAGKTHPYLVGAVVKQYSFELTLADEDRNLVKIVSCDTRDRGTLVTVEAE